MDLIVMWVCVAGATIMAGGLFGDRSIRWLIGIMWFLAIGASVLRAVYPGGGI